MMRMLQRISPTTSSLRLQWQQLLKGPSGRGSTTSSAPTSPGGGRQQGGGAATGDQEYLGIRLALLRLGHTKYDPTVINTKLSVQLTVDQVDTTTRAAFQDFVVNVQQFWMYLPMLGGQSYVMMIHTPGIYYSIKALASVYQAKNVAFIGKRQATKVPTPLCLPTKKSWEWHMGTAVNDFDKFDKYHANVANQGTLWRPGATKGTPEAILIPNLLAICNPECPCQPSLHSRPVDHPT
jgi:hypothetical protein